VQVVPQYLPTANNKMGKLGLYHNSLVSS
jgi:hypothetical protein